GQTQTNAENAAIDIIRDHFGNAVANAVDADRSTYIITQVMSGPGPGYGWQTGVTFAAGFGTDIDSAREGDAISVQVRLPVNMVGWVYGWYLRGAQVESESVVMMRQG